MKASAFTPPTFKNPLKIFSNILDNPTGTGKIFDIVMYIGCVILI